MAPAWMAELSEEWIEPEPVEEAEDDNKQENDNQVDGLDFGSLRITDSRLPSPSQASIDGDAGVHNGVVGFGTTVFHNNKDHDATQEGEQEKSYQMGSILFSPSKKKIRPDTSAADSFEAPSPSQQLAMAAKAFNHDLLLNAEQADGSNDNSMVELASPQAAQPRSSLQAVKTPARLQSLFMMPSSPPVQSISHRSSSPSHEQQQQHLIVEHEDTNQDNSLVIHQDLHDIPEQSILEVGSSSSEFAQSRIVDMSAPPQLLLDNQALEDEDDEQDEHPGLEQQEEQEQHQPPEEQEGSSSRAEPSRIDNQTAPLQTPSNNSLAPHLPSTEFSFRVEPKSPPLPLSSYLESIFATPSQGDEDEVNDRHNGTGRSTLQRQEELYDSRGIATSTPSTSRLASRVPSPSPTNYKSPQKALQTPSHTHDSTSSPKTPTSDTAAAATSNNMNKATGAAQPSPALSIFKFHQDTYTRQHLQALVAEIEGLTSPPRKNDETSYAAVDISDSQFGGENENERSVLSSSRKGMYTQPPHSEYEYSHQDQDPSTSAHTFGDEYSYHTARDDATRAMRMEASPYLHQRHEMILHDMDMDEEDENGRIANTRSSKRVRLSASDYQPDRYHHQQQQHRQQYLSPALNKSHKSLTPTTIPSPIGTRIQNRVMPLRASASGGTPLRSPLRSSASRRLNGQQRLPFTASRLRYSTRNADNSMISNRTNSPARPPLRSLPPLTEPVRRTYKASVLREESQLVDGEADGQQDGQQQVETEQQQETEDARTPPVETPPSRWRHSHVNHNADVHAHQQGKTPAQVVQGRLQEAKALMERIRQRNTQRHTSSASTASSAITAVLVNAHNEHRSPSVSITPDSAVKSSGSASAMSYLQDSNAKRKPVTRDGTLSRPANPTPSTAALAHQWQQNNGRMASNMAPTPEEEEESFNAAPSRVSVMAERPERDVDNGGDYGTAEEERLDSLAPLPRIAPQNTASSTATPARRQLSSSPLVHQAPSSSSITASPAPAHASSFAQSNKMALATAPVSNHNQNRYLQAPRHPPSMLSSHSSSDRFFTSTSTRYVSGSTAPTSLVASSIGTVKHHLYTSEVRHGLMNIPPDEAENLLTEDVLGDMVFDDVNKKWVKIDKYLAAAREREAASIQQENGLDYPARIEGPALSPIEELQGPEEENTADDPFRDITSLSAARSRSDHTGNSTAESSRKHNRSGSLVLPLSASQAASQKSDDDRHTEKTSTPPHVNAAPQFVSPDLPSIPQASSGQLDSRSTSELPQVQLSTSNTSTSAELQNASRRSSGATSVPPKSVLKRSDPNAFSTPLPSSKLISRITSRQTRSVSFSDGKIPGRGDSFDAAQARIVSSALRNEVQYSQISDCEPSLVDKEREDHVSAERDGTQEERDDDTISLDAYTSTVTKGKEAQYNGSRNTSAPRLEHDTPTALYHTYSKPRSLRLRSRGPESLGNSMVSTTSTLAWHRKPLNANATILTECSFGVSYDRLLRVLTDVVPFEPSWKDLDHINLRERGLESVVRLKEFLPNLDEINLSDNNIAYLTGLPSSLRFLSLANNRLGDVSSFVYLKNLESLDISGNTGVTSVKQLSCLQHLRTLKADGCGIDSIEGLDRLDGLVSLSLCNNSIQHLRLESTSWTRLETLDASDNDIIDLSGVETLPVLRSLNLDYNRLLDFSLASSSSSLRILKLSNNSLDSLDLAHVPNVRTVFADCNRITSLSGTSRLRKLENLSLREQRQGHIDFPVKDLRDVRRMYLSYNPIPDAFPSEHFLNLTLLELSGCRLTTLPPNFAAVVPNCRVLILDNNFLTTLAPVSGAKRLRALSAVGNRLDKVKDLLSIWLECVELETLDLRLNPMTLGFYASPNITTAPPNLNILPMEDNMSLQAYKAIDSQHRHTLPNEWLAKRTAYRALVIEAAPSLKLLDGLKVGKTQRQRARELVERFAS